MKLKLKVVSEPLMTLVWLPCCLTFVHTDFNGSTIWANAVAADTHISTRVGHLDIRDEQSTDVGAVITSLERTYKNETNLETTLPFFCETIQNKHYLTYICLIFDKDKS